MSTVGPERLSATEVVDAYRAYRDDLLRAMLLAVRREWGAVEAGSAIVTWLGGVGARIFASIALTQEALSASSVAFVEDVLEVQDLRSVVPALDPLAFAGYSHDSGVDLRRVLFTAPSRTEALLREGLPPPEARRRGGAFLDMVALTEASDALRSADRAATVAAEPVEPRRYTYGWVRVVNPGACSRCAILAGRFYKWNEGFERHPACRCYHVVSTVAASSGLAVDPKAYFDSLDEAERTRLFGRAASEAIEAGGDIYRVVNATTKGKMTIASDGTRWVGGKPSVWQIVKDAAGDRDEAVRRLTEFGYIRR